MDKTVDTTGLSCPQPMLDARNAMKAMGSGVITVLADAEVSRENISRAAHSLGWEKNEESFAGGIWTMKFSKNG